MPSPPPATEKRRATSCGCAGGIREEEQGLAAVVVAVVTVAEGCFVGGWIAETAAVQRLCLCWRRQLVTHLLNGQTPHHHLPDNG